ncbi:Uncharacterised protein [Mycoplasmopsis californica]|uniref:Uncharacterized protein n=1 Tax=Mycoplasmopsis equigenitalium TaxID=114883 RepID=A0ABY5J4L5_9BACT|nr:hypothetical protein [Mycoplasmopsis equigenitalium]UUD36895.1 hypothetical protein NPA09_03285 [Mycoplasmopsis equigenitalium]VEU69810.1 Uncharacterised protein [Mycoplasmopsis californica]
MVTQNATKHLAAGGVGGTTGTVVLLSIAGTLLVLFILYSVIKSVLGKRKIKKQKALIEGLAQKGFEQAILDINALIRENDNKLENFEVSIGTYKMGEITGAARKFLSELIESDTYQTIFKNSGEYDDLYNQTLLLKDTKSNLWRKKLTDTLDFFAGLEENLKNSLEDFENRRLWAKNRIEKLYQKEKNEKL